jgi:hypothetical protein
MRIRLRTLLIVLALGPPVLGCADIEPPYSLPPPEAATLEKGDSFELLSLEPLESPAEEGNFHGWKVLGRVTVEENMRRRLVEALKKGVENQGVSADCFQPRHGIQVQLDGKVFAIVVCFECRSAESFIDDNRGSGFYVSPSPQPVFDDVLRRAGIPLAKPSR